MVVRELIGERYYDLPDYKRRKKFLKQDAQFKQILSKSDGNRENREQIAHEVLKEFYESFKKSKENKREYVCSYSMNCGIASYMLRVMDVYNGFYLMHSYKKVCDELAGLLHYEDWSQPRIRSAILLVVKKILEENDYADKN